MKQKLCAFLGLWTLSVALLVGGIRVDYSRFADFNRYHTYSWIGVKAGNTLSEERIQRAVDDKLAAKGWSKVPTGGEASVSAFVSTKEQPSMQTLYDALPGWDWDIADRYATTFEDIPIGTLVVGIFDSQSKRLIWRGRDSQLFSANPQEKEQTLDKSLRKMFEQFPPQVRQQRG
ncbi:MAG TPA: DUF4136 domain-containing protein [Terriglobales bacterium]|nr:DUF4136 domain-containing protein [Terriglobales bacterium]